ncbi:MAG: hypothetical protein KZQ99_06255 [Candidatus Thiodiazotropha sp. (ex Dulcina madagascariensis)]|nr:hypothetical protein [Candidatus Thiodiazotropha sp. (ex Dulcina madagascariensis)]
MLSNDVAKEIVSRLDKLSELLATTEKMTIYHGFKGGTPMPFDLAEEQLDLIKKTCSDINKILVQQQDQNGAGNIDNLVHMYVNRILENTKCLGEITEKLKQQANGGKKYGFFKFRSDTKEWEPVNNSV